MTRNNADIKAQNKALLRSATDGNGLALSGTNEALDNSRVVNKHISSNIDVTKSNKAFQNKS